MRRYILKRLLQLIPVLLGVTFLSFAMMRLAGSDAITELYGDKGAVSQEIIDAKRAELGLDRPFLSQYFSWLGGLLTGDMGTSYVSGRDVFGTFVSKLPATLLLTALSVGATVLLSVPLGILAAVRHDRFTDYFLRFCSFIGNALPNFFVALLLMQVFSIRWRLLPVLSEGTSLRSAVLPTLTLAIAMSAKYMRQVRAAVLEELNRDYVTGARARGVREGVILRGSVLRCAMLTILTLLDQPDSGHDRPVGRFHVPVLREEELLDHRRACHLHERRFRHLLPAGQRVPGPVHQPQDRRGRHRVQHRLGLSHRHRRGRPVPGYLPVHHQEAPYPASLRDAGQVIRPFFKTSQSGRPLLPLCPYGRNCYDFCTCTPWQRHAG